MKTGIGIFGFNISEKSDSWDTTAENSDLKKQLKK